MSNSKSQSQSPAPSQPATSAPSKVEKTSPQRKHQMKYVVVSGGVISGIGKGIIASSTGLLLKSYGLKVTAIKVDPYLNIDAGLMNPIEHGNCCPFYSTSTEKPFMFCLSLSR